MFYHPCPDGVIIDLLVSWHRQKIKKPLRSSWKTTGTDSLQSKSTKGFPSNFLCVGFSLVGGLQHLRAPRHGNFHEQLTRQTRTLFFKGLVKNGASCRKLNNASANEPHLCWLWPDGAPPVWHMYSQSVRKKIKIKKKFLCIPHLERAMPPEDLQIQRLLWSAPAHSSLTSTYT